MTQSGQGEEPSARPAHEGIVLPSDGGEPLLPGMTGSPAGRPSVPPATGQASAPAGGQAWGQPWGPGHQQGPPQPSDQVWQEPPAAPGWGAAGQQPAVQEPYPQAPSPAWGGPDASQGGPAAGSPYGGALPPEGSSGQGAQHPAAPPSYGGPAAPQPPAAGGRHLPYASGGPSLPPAGPGLPADEGATRYIPPVPGAPAGEGATRYIPPVPGASAGEGATQFLPPAPADGGATQFLPPMGQGALPPEAPGDQDTRFLGRLPQDGAGPLPPAAPGGPADAEATQYIAPVGAGAPYDAPGDDAGRRTPAEFDNLFRSDAAAGPAPATQQMPRVQDPQGGRPYGRPGYAPPGQDDGFHGGGRGGDGGRGRGSGSRVPVIAAVGVGIVVIGIGAGVLLRGGGGGDTPSGGGQNVSATAPADTGSAPAGADPARAQAVALDKLLSDSGSSRAAVIKSVAAVKTCTNLAQASSDLRGAAEQRTGLVTRLGQLQVDKLPQHDQLTAALNGAWRASASADRHYAAWAGQVGGKKGCRKGHARTTGETQAGNRESGVASAQKVKAAQLWNAIARTYGLTQRQPTQL
ncbi:hypothetical protein [Streptomyces tropicalis]|uniref:Basic proline-rich protein n=1 Tax=Streptomyces tropicalis TaxID=3034234 RepID=A0ABT6A799_9ACTN|nr:hypothetical protein [Streptomyces tropicalis]MDF3300503.1 hypothetical protein [Streptomyces tropicalis]